jgi:hypothetical protein
MTEGEKERIKHTANYLNGLAIVIFAGGVLAPLLSFWGEGSLWTLIVLFASGAGLSISLHRLGNYLLGSLDR